ncbi:condensation domain-containing protein, partial [Streptomyces ardesiacus]
ELVWSAHHTILDGWSISLVLGDAVRWYGALLEGRVLDRPAPRPYRDYVAWLGEQDLRQAEDYWRRTLQDVQPAEPLSIERHAAGRSEPPGTGGQAEYDFLFGAEETRRLQELAQTRQLTLNTVLQGCWALLVGRYSGREDVVFGTVASGRPAEIEGIERTVGLFINTLPLRVRMPAQSTVLAWLRELQEQNLRMRQYEYSPLNKVQQWSGLPAGAPLFETLFVFENYPVDKDDEAALRYDLTRSEERINYPLGVVATLPPGQQRLRIVVQYDTARFDPETIERMLGHLGSVCSQLTREPDMRLGDVSVLTDEERRHILRQGNAVPLQRTDETDLDLSALAAGTAGTAEERELLEQLVAEVQGMSPSDLQAQIPHAAPATETSDHHE